MNIDQKAVIAYPVMETTQGIDVNASHREAFKRGYNMALLNAVEILKDEIRYHDIYEEKDIEAFRKRMLEE